MNKVTIHFILLAVCSFAVAGCADRVTEFQADSSGHLVKVGTFTEEESWKRTVERDIDDEVGGRHPWAGAKTWEEYWQTWYAAIRHNKSVSFKSADLKTPEDMVTYMKQRRVARGLPSYE